MANTSRPRLNTPIGTVGIGGPEVLMNRQLYDVLSSLIRNPDQTITTPVVGASPYTYLNDSGYAQTAVVSGGTVSAVEFTRGGAFYPVTGAVPLSPGDGLRITYTVAPTLRIIPV